MKSLLFSIVLFTLVVTAPCLASAEQPPDRIIEKMAIKFTRGIANTAFGFIELPKQHILAGYELGPAGVFTIGPLKGIGMTLYRTFIGITEIVFFMVPQPGYYDPLISPAYVWSDWEPQRDATKVDPEDSK